MPDLSPLFSDNTANVFWDTLLGHNNALKPGSADSALGINFVRVTDRAIFEYEHAREHLLRSMAPGGSLNLLRAVWHFESCIDATNRGIALAQQLRKRQPGPSSLLPTARQQRQVRQMRNAIAHADERIVKGDFTPGRPIMVYPRATRIELGKHTLTYRDLSACITKSYRMLEHIRGAPSV